MYCKEAKKEWVSHVPAPGGHWEIKNVHSEDYSEQKFHLSFIAVISPRPDCTYSWGSFDTLSELLLAMAGHVQTDE